MSGRSSTGGSAGSSPPPSTAAVVIEPEVGVIIEPPTIVHQERRASIRETKKPDAESNMSGCSGHNAAEDGMNVDGMALRGSQAAMDVDTSSCRSKSLPQYFVNLIGTASDDFFGLLTPAITIVSASKTSLRVRVWYPFLKVRARGQSVATSKVSASVDGGVNLNTLREGRAERGATRSRAGSSPSRG